MVDSLNNDVGGESWELCFSRAFKNWKIQIFVDVSIQTLGVYGVFEGG